MSEEALTTDYYVHASSYVDAPCSIGEGTRIWRFCHVMAGASLGKGCSLGQNVHIAKNVKIGDCVKIQNNVSVYEGTIVEDDVFLGPSCVLTNISSPRAAVDRSAEYEKTLLSRGCTIGANATIVCGVTVGCYALVAAGAVVTKDVPAYGLMVGVPARHVGFVSRHGYRLEFLESSEASCPKTAEVYKKHPDGSVHFDGENDESESRSVRGRK